MYRDIYIRKSNNYCIVHCEFNAADTGRKEEKPGYKACSENKLYTNTGMAPVQDFESIFGLLIRKIGKYSTRDKFSLSIDSPAS